MHEKKFVGASIIGIMVILCLTIWWFFGSRNGGEISASGTIEATEVEVSSKVGGTVLKVLVSEGDSVSKGNILAQIDNRELSAVYRQAKANSDLAENNLARVKELSNKGFASAQTLDQANANFEAAMANEELASIKLRDATVVSPISGHVIVKSIEEGELASPGSSIATIADISKVHLMVYVSEKEVGKIRLGDRVFVTVDSYPNQRFEGRVSYISKQAEFTPKTIQTREERVTQVFGVKVEVDNRDMKLKPGLPADAAIKI